MFPQGDYKCDTPDGADLPETHIAAWDHPSMDYVSKDDENIIFTLCQVVNRTDSQYFVKKFTLFGGGAKVWKLTLRLCNIRMHSTTLV